jgi:predicted enzyme related to lactoylglutathione lyase
VDIENGSIVWFDIPVKDFEPAKAFYGELLGWKFQPMGDAKSTSYWLIKVGDEMIGGLRKAEGSIVKTEAPVIHFAVSKLDPAIARAKQLGATLVGERNDIPDDMGSFQWLRDKDGNLVSIWAKN